MFHQIYALTKKERCKKKKTKNNIIDYDLLMIFALRYSLSLSHTH